MEGTSDGAFDASGTTSTDQLQNIHNAINATLDPRTSNGVRQQALSYLEHVKTLPDGPQYGFTLADDWNQTDAVRYYGLQLLEHSIRYRWSDYREEQTQQIRTWVKCLAGSIREQDALYIRNKIAQLWVEVAKRCWGEEWMDMDKLLVTLWEKPLSEKGAANKLFVLYILEMLSEDVINSEDSAAGLRLDILGTALNEIMVPAALYSELTTAGKNVEWDQIRTGDAGWLARICDFFSSCVKEARLGGQKEMLFCAAKALQALRPTMGWINLKGAVEVNSIDCLFLPFHTEDIALQTAATEVLYVLLGRPYGQHWHDSWMSLMQQTLNVDRIAMTRQTFQRTHTTPGEDDEKHTLQKKLSEVLWLLMDAIAQHSQLAHAAGLDMPALFDLLLLVLQNNSLVVSIPVLHGWTKLLTVQDNAVTELVFKALGTLVQTCSLRLLKYESVPEDAEDEVAQFLFEDFDTMPERHAFLGNYRRYCVNVIQTITRSRPLEALSHVLGQMKEMLETGQYTAGRGFDPSRYSKTGLATLQFDAQYQVVSSALKGYSQWLADVANLPPEDEQSVRAEADKSSAMQSLQQWCYEVINTHSDDPEVAALLLQTLVTILRTVKPEPSFVLHIVQHLLTMRLYDNPAHSTFSDAVKAFEGLRVLELQKLALVFSNELLEVYNELEPRIGVLVEKHTDDPRLVWGYRAFLFMIIHRASGIDNEMRMARLQQMLKPVYEAWQDPAFSASLSSLQSFCESLDLADLAGFYKYYGFDQNSDWSSQRLDEAGQARQASIKAKNDALPLRMTKSMLAGTTEKLKSGSEEFEIGCALWGHIIPVILPNLLQMVRHAQAFHNMNNWSQLPEELQAVIKRTLQDRFWQSGISNESKDEFYARISESKASYEGFASAVRGSMRNIREQSYHLIYFMTKFEEQFFGLSELAGPLANALFADAGSLSANHLNPLINLTTGLVQRCPPHYRAQFLPPLLTQFFKTLDARISSEWDTISHANEQSAEGDDLSEEMRKESVLRALTYSMVSFVPFLLEFDKSAAQHTAGRTGNRPLLSAIILSDPSVLEPLIMFCTHALRMRDTRCCTAICKTFRTLVPEFHSDEAPAPQVREFISTEVLKACITSLHEPYFADTQKELASLIAQILLLYAPKTGTPRAVLLSLPDMPAAKVDKTLGRMCKEQTPGERQLRALVLDLLEGVRGVSIHEAGRIVTPKKVTKKKAPQQQHMQVEEERPAIIVNGEEAGLESVAGLFGDG